MLIQIGLSCCEAFSLFLQFNLQCRFKLSPPSFPSRAFFWEMNQNKHGYVFAGRQGLRGGRHSAGVVCQ